MLWVPTFCSLNYNFLISDGSTLNPLLEDQDNASVDRSRSNTLQLHPINNPSGKAIDAKIKFLNKSQEENASIPA